LQTPEPAKRQAADKPSVKLEPTPKQSALAWMVQLGTFRDERNARALEAKLAKLGFHGRVEHSVTAGGLSLRVLVGPESTASNAEQLRARVAASTGIKGVVIRSR
jgi:DedD protein